MHIELVLVFGHLVILSQYTNGCFGRSFYGTEYKLFSIAFGPIGIAGKYGIYGSFIFGSREPAICFIGNYPGPHPFYGLMIDEMPGGYLAQLRFLFIGNIPIGMRTYIQ